jgi:dipeptidyl aminopeptidase/acylaminoacyl peptidase
MVAMRVGIAALVAAFVWATSAFAAPPPLEAYARKPALTSLTISPDGRHVAFGAVHGDDQLVRVRPTVGGLKPRSLNLGDGRLYSITWAGPDHVLVMTRRHYAGSGSLNLPAQDLVQGRSFDVRTGEAVLLLRDTKGAAAVLAGYPMIGRHEGAPAIYTGSFNPSPFTYTLHRVSPDTGMGVRVDKGTINTLEWLVDAEGRLVARTEREDDGRWLLKARAGDQWVTRASIDPKGAPAQLIGLGRDGASVLVSRSQTGEPGLYEIALADGRWSAPLIPVGSRRGSLFFDTAAGGRLAAAQVFDPEPRLISFSPDYERAWKALVAAFPNRNIYPAGFDDAKRKAVVYVTGTDEPGANYLVDLESNSTQLLGKDYPDIPADQLAATREVRYPAQDGLEIPARLTLPRGREAKGLPVIVLAGGYSTGFDWQAQALASRGYAVLQPRVRGPWNSSPELERRGDGEFGRKTVSDYGDGVRWLAEQGLVDPARSCFVGPGLAGYAGLASVTVQEGPYRCVAATNALADPRRYFRRQRELTGSASDANEAALLKLFGVKSLNNPALETLSPVEHAARGKAPVLLVYNEQATGIRPDQSLAMAAALKKAGRRHEVVALPGPAGFDRNETRIAWLQAVVRFLEAENPPA